jgi:hypothetical protein
MVLITYLNWRFGMLNSNRPSAFNLSKETHTEFLRRKAKKVGHYAISRWMMKQGYPFRYAYFVIFNKFPEEETR